MLEAILEVLGYGQVWSIDNLSKELGIPKKMVRAAIEFLEQSKYIKRIRLNNCNGKCKTCHSCEGMELLSTQSFMWEIVHYDMCVEATNRIAD